MASTDAMSVDSSSVYFDSVVGGEKKRRRGQRDVDESGLPQCYLRLLGLVALSKSTALAGRLLTLLRIRSKTG